MKKNILNYYIPFYFYSVLFFIQGLFSKRRQPIPAPVSSEINLLNEEESVLMKKPSQTEAMANKAMMGLSAIPKEHKKKIIIGIILTVFFILFGVVNFIYWSIVIIKKYNIVGLVLLEGILVYITYLILNSIYNYLKNKKYQPIILMIQIIWHEATLKAKLKLGNTNYNY